MQRKVDLQPAWLLHSRPFRDTSLLLDFLTCDYGRVTVIGKGVRTANSRLKGVLQLFMPLQISFSGKSELKTLTQAELLSTCTLLRGQQLFSALYMNELLVRLVHSHEADPSLFHIYQDTLAAIRAGEPLEPLLRRFEVNLLESIGYGLVFDADLESGRPVENEGMYQLQGDSGFVRVLGIAEQSGHDPRLYPGSVLLAISQDDYSAPETLAYAKRLMRSTLSLHLGDKPLRSRQLFARS